MHKPDRNFLWFLRIVASAVIACLLSVGLFLLLKAWPALYHTGLRFLYTNTWDPVGDVYGALPVVFGTLLSSFLALILSVPLSLGIALFVSELAPRRLARFVSFTVEMLAAIPSVVYGLWGIFVLAPWLRTVVEPFLGTYFGFLPFFQGPPYGVGMLAASLILAVMITPTISSIAREIFRAVPSNYREAALALGATRWEMIRLSVLSASWSGVLGAVVLGLGRALGETMAVTMVIGNRADISLSLFSPGQSMASVIANEYVEATSDIHLAALAEVGLLLFAVTFLVNSGARLIVLRLKTKGGGR
ncbi:MAG: phosphate ABC transporter permease subunit PstC [Deltaproteobacteria bacterium]|nr:phosphate ABC transporter permease subunit PstC [Deltaproteobacteria bacterium]MBI3293879.1 phosphate ABC transporter permease subunit PstC [Deltaproteobacteria bacterium]